MNGRNGLKIGAVIQLESLEGKVRQFHINRVLGYGGTCIVYEAYYRDEFSLRHGVKLKELFPAEGAERTLSETNVGWKSEDVKAESMKRFEWMYRQHVALQQVPQLVNAICKVSDTLYFGNQTAYLIMENDNGKSFDSAVPDNLYDIFRNILALCETVGRYHDLGFLHLDIKPQNFMVIEETSELVKLFDFDSFTSMDDITSGTIEALSFSNAWAAPEVRQGKIGKIRETADIYSIGACLFYAVFGRNLQETDQLDV